MNKLYSLLLLSLWLLLSSHSAFSQDLNKLDEKNGLQKFILNSDVRNLTDVEPDPSFKANEDFNRYKYHGVLTVGNYKVHDIVLDTYKNRIRIIYFKTEDDYDTKGLLKVLRLAYGQDEQSSSFGSTRHKWDADKVVLFFHTPFDIKDKGTGYFCYKPISDEMVKDHEEREKKAVDEL